MDQIIRPKAEKRKIHSKDEFELCYLRHQYLRRVTFNPSQAQMAPFMGIVTNLAKHTYFTYKNLFRLVGFDLEDVISIGKVHLVSFLGLYELSQVPKKYYEFVDIHVKNKLREPTSEDLENKNKANLTGFLKQRMEDVVRVCRQKGRNIKGMATEEFYVFYGAKKPPKDIYKLLEDHEKYGFRKLDLASFKSVSKRAKKIELEKTDKRTRQKIEIGKAFLFSGYYHIAVPLEKRNLTLEDLSGADLDPYDSIHNKNPEELMLMEESTNSFEKQRVIFEAQTDKRKEVILRRFIHKNKNNPLFKEEVALARKFANDLLEK